MPSISSPSLDRSTEFSPMPLTWPRTRPELSERLTTARVGGSSSVGSDPDTTPTIYEWGGGRPAFERWLNTFYDLVEGDDLLAPVFGGLVTKEHREHVTTWWCEVMGGPAAYTDDLGGYPHMLAKHRGLEIAPQ